MPNPESDEEMHDEINARFCSDETSLPHTLDEESLFKRPYISCCRFSADASRMLLGHTDGKVQLFRMDDGRICLDENRHGQQVVACCFAFGGSRDTLLTIDVDGCFVVWRNAGVEAVRVKVESGDLVKNWRCPGTVSLELRRPSLSEDGGRLVCPVKVERQKFSGLLVSVFDTRDVFPWPMVQLSIPSSPHCHPGLFSAHASLDTSSCLFSPDGRGLMLSLDGAGQGLVILWPDFSQEPDASYMVEGIFFSWSPDCCLAVTWDPLQGNSSELTKGKCRVWDVLRMQPEGKARDEHPKFNGQNPVVLCVEGPILWCGFLSSELLVTCTVDKCVKISVWDALAGMVVHEIGTEIDYQHLGLRAAGLWQGVSGMRVGSRMDCQPLAISHERSWIAMYSQSANVGHVFDGEMGVELLKFSLPDDCKCDGEASLVFCQNANKFAILGETRVLMMCLNTGVEKRPDGDPQDLMRFLERHGPVALNYPDYRGVSMLAQCADDCHTDLLATMLTRALDCRVKVEFCFPLSLFRRCKAGNALYVALKRRSPEAVRTILDSLLEGVTTEYSLSHILRDSLVKLAKVYPEQFYSLMMDERFMRVLGHFRVREAAFEQYTSVLGSNNFLVMTDDRLIAGLETPSTKFLSQVWEERVPEAQLLGGNSILAQALVVPVKDIAQMGNGGLIRNLLLQKVDHSIYGTFPIKYVIAYKWRTYGSKLLVEELWHYLLLLLAFTLYVFLLGHKSTYDLFFLFLSMAMAAMNMVREVEQLCTYWRNRKTKGLYYWFSSHWNLVELASYALLVFVIPALHLADKREEARVRLANVLAAEVILLWWRLLYYAQPFEATGPMVIMIREIIRDIRFFLFLGFAVLFGFAVAFFVIYKRSGGEWDEFAEANEDLDGQFGTFGRSLLTMFSMMLGDFSVDVLHVAPRPGVAITLFILYMMGMMIILLNLLIAIMGHSFDRIKESEETKFLRARAKAIDDIESMLSSRRRRKLMKGIRRYLHVLIPQNIHGFEQQAIDDDRASTS